MEYSCGQLNSPISANLISKVRTQKLKVRNSKRNNAAFILSHQGFS
jgi:hypothetical protein